MNTLLTSLPLSAAVQPALPVRGLCAHRGANRTHPENTLAAFREALRLGAHQVELDVYLTAYGDLVVLHDPRVDRTTDGSGDIRGMTLAQIKCLDAGIRKHPRFAGERIPTLEEALAIMPQQVWLNVQLKGGAELGAAAARKVADCGRLHQAFLAARREAAEAARKAVPQILIGNLERHDGNHVRYVRDTLEQGDAFIQFHRRFPLPEANQIQCLKDAGVHINYCGTNDPDQLEALYALGIDFPLVDDLEPMLARAHVLGIAPWSGAAAGSGI